MNDDEKKAERYLVEQGYISVEFEPNGNVPPDFVLDKQIAVEVRRLDQRYEGIGIDVHSRPLEDAMNSVLTEFDYQYSGTSYFVWLRVHRPLPQVKIVKQAVRELLKEFLISPPNLPSELYKIGNFGIRIFPASPVLNRVFLPGSGIDLEDGGFLIPEMVENIRTCAEEKAKKIEPFLNQFEKWWLILIDHIAFGTNEEDRHEIKQQVLVDPIWEKIIVVSADNIQNAFEIVSLKTN